MWWRQFAGPKVNLRPSAALGEILAAEVLRLDPGPASVVLISRQPAAEGPDANRERMDNFKVALKRTAPAKSVSQEWMPRPPPGVMDLGVASQEQILSAMEKHADAKIFVVLAGLPPAAPSLVDKLNARSAKLVGVCGSTADVKRWLASKVLAVVVVPRFDDLPPGTPSPQTARDWFDREYLLVTPETAQLLP